MEIAVLPLGPTQRTRHENPSDYSFRCTRIDLRHRGVRAIGERNDERDDRLEGGCDRHERQASLLSQCPPEWRTQEHERDRELDGWFGGCACRHERQASLLHEQDLEQQQIALPTRETAQRKRPPRRRPLCRSHRRSGPTPIRTANSGRPPASGDPAAVTAPRASHPIAQTDYDLAQVDHRSAEPAEGGQAPPVNRPRPQRGLSLKHGQNEQLHDADVPALPWRC